MSFINGNYTTASGSGTTITETGDYTWTFADTGIRVPSISYLYIQATQNFTTYIPWSTSGGDQGRFDRLFYYVGTDNTVFDNLDLNTTTAIGNNPPANFLSVPDFNYNTTSTQSGILEVNIEAGQYFGLLFDNSDGSAASTITLTGMPTESGACFIGDTYVLMGDNTMKKIKDIKR